MTAKRTRAKRKAREWWMSESSDGTYTRAHKLKKNAECDFLGSHTFKVREVIKGPTEEMRTIALRAVVYFHDVTAQGFDEWWKGVLKEDDEAREVRPARKGEKWL